MLGNAGKGLIEGGSLATLIMGAINAPMPGESMDQQALLAITFKEALGLAVAVVIMALGGVGWLLKYFFSSTLKEIKERGNQTSAELKETTNFLRGEISGMKDRLAAVELDLAKNYVPRTDWTKGLERVYDQMKEIKICPLSKHSEDCGS